MLRLPVATVAALLLVGCDHLPETDPSEASPVESAARIDEDDPPYMRFPVKVDTTAEVEREADLCDAEHPSAPSPDLRRYAIWQRFPLRREEHGVDGVLRVLQDSRFTGPGFARAGTHPLLPPCDRLPGRMEVLDADGRPVEAMDVSPQADVTAHSFGPRQTLYQVKELVQCLASCWCGDHVSFWQVVEGHLVPLSTQRSGGKVEPVRGVTRGCYEGGGVGRGADGRLEVQIHRTVLIIPSGLSVEERHGWDGGVWRGSVVERKIPW